MDGKPEFFGKGAKALQAEQGTEALAAAIELGAVSDSLNEDQERFISRLDFMFMSSVSAAGEPTVSYKGGAPGFVKVLRPDCLIFPNFDGNGMFMSMGNVAETSKIGLLFIDFETPNRLRVQGKAELSQSPELMALYPGANMVVEVSITSVFPNCARYVHKHQRVEASPYVPDAAGDQPYPAWKRIDVIQPLLHPRDQGKALEHGGTITQDEYADMLKRGTT